MAFEAWPGSPAAWFVACGADAAVPFFVRRTQHKVPVSRITKKSAPPPPAATKIRVRSGGGIEGGGGEGGGGEGGGGGDGGGGKGGGGGDGGGAISMHSACA